MRKLVNTNKGWSFLKDTKEIPATLPAEWEVVNVPHTWNNIDGMDGGADYYATNIDMVCPIEGGRYLPDCGSFADMCEQAVKRRPRFLGKPDRTMIDIIAKAQSGEYEALLRELLVYGEPDGYYRLLGEVAEVLNTTIGTLQSRPDEVQLALCKTYVNFWLCDKVTIQRELERIHTLNGRTISDIQEYELGKTKAKTPAEPVQTADKVPTFEELYDAYQRRHVNDHFTREAHKHLAEIARRRQRDEQERIIQTEERERKNRP